MDLVGRVLRALEERSVHPAEFERCACALLHDVYPGLSAVEGGHDFGRDADIYFPLGDSDADGRGRLLATTGDPEANLRRGLRRMQEEDVRVDLIVMACVQPVRGTKRAALDRLCSEQGLPEPHVYARDWFVARLVAQPDWRFRLLDLRGELEALLARPLEMLEHATPDPPDLVGRETERAGLQSLIDTGRDAVLVGVPGVGKTRLTTELDRSVAFLQHASHRGVVDALVSMKPVAVVVDDAHARPEELRVLRQTRIQEGLAFSIIASTWPDRVEEVLTELPGADTVTVELLERSEMDALVCSVGVTGHRARMLILEQAEGRPGWALALCEVLVTGDEDQVATGAAYLAHAERFLRRATGSQTALDALACVAALRVASPEIVYKIASLVGVPPAELVDTLTRLARNGLLDQRRHGWSVQPTLRPALIARWFFTPPAGRPWSTLVAAFPAEKPALVSAAISAARLGSAQARHTVEQWAQSIPEPASWDTAIGGLLVEYATVDEQAARFAVSQARTALAASLSPPQLAASIYDYMTPVLKRLIAQAAQLWLLPEAVSTLLDLAIDDPRPRPQNPDHPLRVLADLAHVIDPDFGTGFPIRERLLECTLAWVADHPGPDRWIIAAELLAAIFSPRVSGQWPKPGTPNTITIAGGYESAANLQRLLELWPRVAQTVITDSRSSAPVCPPEAIALLVDLTAEWIKLSAGLRLRAEEVLDDQRQAGRAGAHQILESLRPVITPVPGLAVRAQRLRDRSQQVEPPMDRPAPFDLDADLLAFLGPHRQSGRNIEAEWRERDRRIEDLAQRLSALTPANGTARFAHLDRQARLAGHQTGQDAEWLATRMRAHLTDPLAWYRAAHDQQVPALLRASLKQILDHDPTALPSEALTTHLHDPALRPTIVAAMLARTDNPDQLSRQVIADLTASDARMLCELISPAAPTEVLRDLLRHPDPAVAGATALSFAIGQPHGPALPDSWHPDWATAIGNLRVADLDQNTQWRTEQLLTHLATHDPDLFEQWFARRLDDMSTQPFLALVDPHGCEHHLTALPRPHRERLTRQYCQLLSTGKPRIDQTLLTYLIGTDRDLAERLLNDQVITTEHLLDAIGAQRNQILEQLGPLLLERGIAPEHIAASAGSPAGGWVGPHSAMYTQIADYFTSLGERVPTLQPVAQAGCAQQTAKKLQADADERQERIHGR